MTKQFSLQGPHQQQPSPFAKDLPPLKPSVKPFDTTEASGFATSEEIGNCTMAPFKLTRTGLGARHNLRDKTYTLPEDNYNMVIEEIKRLRQENKELDEELAELRDEMAILESQAKKKPASAKSNRKMEQNEDVVNAVNHFVKDVLFRNVKFAPPGDQLKNARGKVWAGLKDKLNLDKGPRPLNESDFGEIYGSAILTALSGRRQCVQSRCELAAKGKKFCALLFSFCLFYTK